MNDVKNNLLALDFETTGLDYNKDQPCSLGLIVYDINLDKIDSKLIYVIPEVEISTESFNIHKLSLDFLLENGMPLDQLEREVYEFIEKYFPKNDRGNLDVKFCGHNISIFDILFFTKYCNTKSKINYRQITDTRQICDFINMIRKNSFEGYLFHKEGNKRLASSSLKDVCRFFKIETDCLHNALFDAELSVKVLQSIKRNIKIGFFTNIF